MFISSDAPSLESFPRGNIQVNHAWRLSNPNVDHSAPPPAKKKGTKKAPKKTPGKKR